MKKNIFKYLLYFCTVALTGLYYSVATAATVTCTGTYDPGTQTTIHYDASTNTCTIADDVNSPIGPDAGLSVGDIYFWGNDNTGAVRMAADNDLNGSVSRFEYQSCIVGDLGTVTPAASCSDGVNNVSVTNSITSQISASQTGVLNVSYTHTAWSALTITAASVTITTNDNTAPTITGTTVSPDNSSIAVTFSESVYTTTGSSGSLTAADFALSISGGTASLSSTTPTSISTSGNTYTLGLSLSGIVSGSETITVVPASSSAIYDAADNAAITTQLNNTITLNDTTGPTVQILNAPGSLTGLDSFNVTFEFSDDVTGFAVSDISIANGSAGNFSVTDGNTYTADITPSGQGNLTIDISAGVAHDTAPTPNPNIAASRVSVTCGIGCGESATITQTKKVLQNYAGNRVRQITAQGLAISGFLSGDGMGGNLGGFFQTPIALNFNGDERSGSGSFSTSLQQLTTYGANLSKNTDSIDNVDQILSPANVWIKGHWSKTNDERGGLNDETDFGIIYLGTDYRYSEDLLIGLMVQYDWFDQSDSELGSQAKGNGWMFGPYIVTQLKDSLTADLRFAWGQSDNQVNPLGHYWDNYESERWQIEGNLTGSFKEENWHIAPSIGLNYFKETQQSYVDSNGITISEDSTELGTLSFGPKVTYLANKEDGSQIHPFILAKGVWNFKAPDIYDINGISSGTEELRGLVGVGISVTTPKGTHIQASYTYDGIGIDHYESRSMDLSVNINLDEAGMPKGSSLRATYSLANILMLQSENTNNAKIELTVPFN